jgi:hypothetical protein
MKNKAMVFGLVLLMSSGFTTAMEKKDNEMSQIDGLGGLYYDLGVTDAVVKRIKNGPGSLVSAGSDKVDSDNEDYHGTMPYREQEEFRKELGRWCNCPILVFKATVVPAWNATLGLAASAAYLQWRQWNKKKPGPKKEL